MLLTLLALATPLPAMALNSDGSEPVSATPAPAALSVSTALDSCGIVDTQVVCKLNVSFNTIAGASSYTATVTRADGSVVDYGSVGAGGASLWVPYVGAGGYSVRISAYGTPPGETTEGGASDEQGNLITSEATEAKPSKDGEAGNADVSANPGARGGDSTTEEATPTDDPGADPGTATQTDTCETDPGMVAPPEPPPPLPPAPPQDSDPENPDEDGDGVPDADEQRAYDEALAAQQAAAMAAEAQLPESIQCSTQGG